MPPRYTPEEDHLVLCLRKNARLSWSAIAARLGRGCSGGSVRDRYQKTQARPADHPNDRGRRTCLACLSGGVPPLLAMFRSSGPGNRICAPCSVGRGRVFDVGEMISHCDVPDESSDA